MNTIDLTPLYRSSIGFDRMGSLLDNALRSQKAGVGFPPYDIETTGEDRYAITLALPVSRKASSISRWKKACFA